MLEKCNDFKKGGKSSLLKLREKKWSDPGIIITYLGQGLSLLILGYIIQLYDPI